MKRFLSISAVALCVGFAAPAMADDRPSHFKGQPSPTLEAAVANFSEHNKQLAALLAKDNLRPEDMLKVHELTYTLENALGKLRDELSDLADTLEEVHVASEKLDAKAVKAKGEQYLKTARQVIQ